MAENWQKGDLALCVNDHPARDGTPCPAKRGCVYTVENVFVTRFGNTGLTFQDVSHLHTRGYHATRFRKITPPKPDEFDREIIDLMRGKKVPA